jgi:hypothetical protein
MKSDWRQKRAQREAVTRANAKRLNEVRDEVSRRTGEFLKHDLGDQVGYSPLWETTSPFRHGSPLSSTGPADMTKPPGSPD